MRKIWRHKKTGGLYLLLHDAKMQTKHWTDIERGVVSADMAEVIVYQSLQDDLIWVRPAREFNERFELMSSIEYREGEVVLSANTAF